MNEARTIRELASALRELVDPEATIDLLATGFQFTEGPLWDAASQSLLFSDLAGDAIRRWDDREGVRYFRRPSGKANGLARDRSGRLIACEHIGRRVTRTEADGSLAVLAAAYRGTALNSPNDVVVKSDGAIYFSDPPYGLQDYFGVARPQDLSFNAVYRIDPGGDLHLLVDDFAAPNGLAFSPDERLLYVDDTEHNHLRVFDVALDGSLSNSRVFFDFAATSLLPPGQPGRPDGLKLDERGNVYCTGPGGIWVLNPNARPLGLLSLPEIPSNLTWGGPHHSTLYITAQTSVYRLQLRVAGNRSF